MKKDKDCTITIERQTLYIQSETLTSTERAICSDCGQENCSPLSLLSLKSIADKRGCNLHPQSIFTETASCLSASVRSKFNRASMFYLFFLSPIGPKTRQSSTPTESIGYLLSKREQEVCCVYESAWKWSHILNKLFWNQISHFRKRNVSPLQFTFNQDLTVKQLHNSINTYRFCKIKNVFCGLAMPPFDASIYLCSWV